MCFDFDAHPPDLPPDLALRPVAGGAAAESLELTSDDGTRVAAAIAPADESGRAGVVILPDVRGLYRFYVELAERFAQAGHSAIALDYFGRTAGVEERDNEWDFWPHVEQTRMETVQMDALAALSELKERTGVSKAVTVGFCFGGTHSFLAATSEKLGLDGVVGFYGSLAERPFRPSPLGMTGHMRCPVLALFGGADQGIPPDQVDAFDEALSRDRVDHEIVTYPGAPHSFFDRSYEQHAAACDDAWRRTLGFIAER